MQLYFIRHGQSENNELWARTGSSEGRSEDAELTALGRRQAELLARFLNRPGKADDSDPQNINGFGITHLYCSLMVRAVETGTIIARELGLPLIAWRDLHEVGGIYLVDGESGQRVGRPGKDRSFFERHYPHLVLPEGIESGWWNRPFETKEEAPARAGRVWGELLERHGNTSDRVALVSHGGFYNYLLAAIIGLADRSGLWFSLNNAAITRVDLVEGRVGIVYANRVDFLPPDMIT